MRRRAFACGLGLTAAAVSLPKTRIALARPVPEPDPLVDRRPISLDNPRVWPPVSRDRSLLMGAVEAFQAPARAAEMGVQWQRLMFDWSALQPSSASAPT